MSFSFLRDGQPAELPRKAATISITNGGAVLEAIGHALGGVALLGGFPADRQPSQFCPHDLEDN
jgi:hypothetical protein